jgi:hypothetical protein
MSRPRKRTAVLLATGLAAVATATIAIAVTRDDGNAIAGPRVTKSPSPGLAFDAGTAKGTGPVSVDAVALPPVKGAPDPTAAVQAFLDAEIAKDFGASFAVLADADRTASAPVAQWAATHVDLPHYLSYQLVGPATVDGPKATVVADVAMQPGLDSVVGLRPAQARITWTVTQEQGGWRVALRRSRGEARYADASGAPAAARAWATGRQQCSTTGQFEGSLVGFPTIADALCHTTGAVSTPDAAEPLSAVGDASPVTSFFGPDAAAWAKVVRVDGPVPMRAVLAPVGDQWVVIGVFPPA